MSSHMKPCARHWCFLLDKWKCHKILENYTVSFYKKKWDQTGRNQWGRLSQIASTKGDKCAPSQQTCQICWGYLACFYLPWKAENYPTFFESAWWMHLVAISQSRFRGKREYEGRPSFSHGCLQIQRGSVLWLQLHSCRVETVTVPSTKRSEVRLPSQGR